MRRALEGLFDDAPGVVGDLYCTVEEARTGISQVSRLATFYVAQGKPRQFAAAVGSILTRYQALAPRMEDRAGYVGPWCEMKALGAEAEALTGQIAKATGAASPVALTKPGFLDGIGSIVLGAAALIAGGVVVSKVLARRNDNDR